MSLRNVSVTGSGINMTGLTGANYSALIHASVYRYALGFTIVYTIITVLVELVLGTVIALVLERLTAGRGWMMALLLIPWSMITVINAELWGYIYEGTYGVLQALFQASARPPEHPRHFDPRNRRDDGGRHLEDHAVRGHHRAGRSR